MHTNAIRNLPSDPLRWSSFDVQLWLAQQGLAAYVGAFRDNDVVGVTLTRLSEEVLMNDLGMHSAEDRQRLLGAIKELGPAGKSVEAWNEEDVCTWLAAIGLPQLVHTFRLYGITGSLLVLLTADDMRDDLGVRSFGTRDRLMEQIKLLKKEHEEHGSRTERAPTSATRPRSAARALSGGSEPNPTRQEAQVHREIWLTKEIANAENRVSAAQERLRKAMEGVEAAEMELRALQHELDGVRRRQAGEHTADVKKQLFQKRPKSTRGTSDTAACTFTPTINQNSRRLANRTRSPGDISQLSASKKTPRSPAASPSVEENKRNAAAFFREEMRVDVHSEEADDVLQDILNNPEARGLQLTESQVHRMRKMSRMELAVALHSSFKIARFINRLKQQQVAHEQAEAARKHAEKQAEYEAQVVKAHAFLRQRFGLTEVTDDSIYTLLTTRADEVGLTERETAQVLSAVGAKRAHVLHGYLQAHMFLERTAQDMQTRHDHLKRLNAEREEGLVKIKTAAFKVTGDDVRPLPPFFQRYEEDLEKRRKKLEQLSGVVAQAEEEECTFHPCTTVNGGMQAVFSQQAAIIAASPSKETFRFG